MEMLTDNPAKKLARQSSLSLEKGGGVWRTGGNWIFVVLDRYKIYS